MIKFFLSNLEWGKKREKRGKKKGKKKRKKKKEKKKKNSFLKGAWDKKGGKSERTKTARIQRLSVNNERPIMRIQPTHMKTRGLVAGQEQLRSARATAMAMSSSLAFLSAIRFPGSCAENFFTLSLKHTRREENIWREEVFLSPTNFLPRKSVH